MEKRTIIYVDDDLNNLELFELNFKRKYHVLTSDNPEKAIQIIKDNHIKVVITDYKMPIMNGLNLIYSIKEFQPNCACMILSGYLESDVISDKLKVFKYIPKPYRKSEMIENIEEAFNSLLEAEL